MERWLAVADKKSTVLLLMMTACDNLLVLSSLALMWWEGRLYDLYRYFEKADVDEYGCVDPHADTWKARAGLWEVALAWIRER